MNPKMLAKQFAAEPGGAIIDVIRSAETGVTKAKVVAILVAAGVRKQDAGARWDSAQKYLKIHPHIRSAKGSQQYEWSTEPVPSSVALDRLEGQLLKSTPSWFKQALSAVVRDSLARNETSGIHSQMTWSEHQQAQQARLIAEFATALEDSRTDAEGRELAKWLARKIESARLEAFGSAGDIDKFDPDVHEATAPDIRPGDGVVLLRPGFRWYGADHPQTLIRARVQAK